MADHGSSSSAEADLEKLAAELGSRGFTARLVTPEGRVPSLEVSDPGAVSPPQAVMAGLGFFWWPWAEKIAGVTDVHTAAGTITRVLAARSGYGT